VGHARRPARYLADQARLVTEVSGIGRLDNVARRDTTDRP
jgi:acylpyruvate hydrolase